MNPDQASVSARRVARAAARARRAAAPVYVPLLVLGLLAQVAALALRSVWVGLAGLVVAALAELATADHELELRPRLDAVGVSAPLRAALRALLFAAVLVTVVPGVAVPGTYALAMVAVVSAAIVHDYSLHRIVDFAPPLAVRNLGADLELTRLVPSLAISRRVGTGVLLALEIPVAAFAAAGGAGVVTAGVPGGSPMATIALMGLILLGLAAVAAAGAAAWWVRRLLRSGRIARYRDALAAEIAGTGAQVVVHFSGDPPTTYQLTSWMPVFEQLEHPTVLVVREREHLPRLPETRWPVIFAERPSDLEVLLPADPKVVLYVANAGRNLHLVRYARPKHLFLNHGDSDKASSANPVVKMYDRLLVAGPLGVRRYNDAGIDLPDEHFIEVGRPQLDRVLDRGRTIDDDAPTTLLYAPTWEGYVAPADYSSTESMGQAMVDAVLDSHPDVRIVFKPHPMVGDRRRSAVAATRRIAARLREAGDPHVVATDHPERDLYDWFDRSDVLLTDVSAVATDYLHTHKPFLVTNPHGLEATAFTRRFPTHRAAYLVTDPADVSAELTTALGRDPRKSTRTKVRKDVLGEHPDGPLASFRQAVDDMIARAEHDAKNITNTYAVDGD